MFITTTDIESSLEYRIYWLLATLGWVHPLSMEPLQKYSVDRVANPWATVHTYRPANHTLGFSHVGPSGEIRNDIVVKAGNAVVDAGLYTLDMRNGWVIFATTPPAGVLTVTGTGWGVRVWKGDHIETDFEDQLLPSVAYMVTSDDARPMGISTAAQFISHDINIDVLCRNDTQRGRLTSELRRLLTVIPLLDLAAEPILGFGNTINIACDLTEQFQNYLRITRVPSARYLRSHRGQNDSLRYRSIIDLRVEYSG